MSIGSTTYFREGDNLAFSRYQEALLLQQDGYREMQYWFQVLNRARTFGLNNSSIAEINTQIQRTSEKLAGYNRLLSLAQQTLQADNQGLQQDAQLFQ